MQHQTNRPQGQSARILDPRRFNDDDLYIYNPKTFELDKVVPASMRRGYPVPRHLVAKIGLTAKRLGLWHRVEAA